MKGKIAIFCALALALLLPLAAMAQVHVKGYTKKDGTYVAPHYRSSPNQTRADNYSTRGNINPYTGKTGTRDPYSPPAHTYQPQQSNSYTPKPRANLYSPKPQASPYGNSGGR